MEQRCKALLYLARGVTACTESMKKPELWKSLSMAGVGNLRLCSPYSVALRGLGNYFILMYFIYVSFFLNL